MQFGKVQRGALFVQAESEPHKTTDRKTTNQIPPDRDPGNQSKNPG
jgi:hypothetical protein